MRIRSLPSLSRLLGILVVGLALTACDSDDDPTTPPMQTTIVDVIGQQDNLGTLGQAVDAAGLGDALSGDQPLTVFAPRDAAFEALTVQDLLDNPDLLAEVLQYHVVRGAALAGDLSDGQTFETLQGDELTVSIDGGTVRINGATVTTPNLEAENGVVHVVDQVLLENRTAYERISVTAATQTLQSALDTAGLADALNDTDATYTIFAPTESAFEGVDVSGLSEEQLTAILQYHVIPGAAVAAGDITDGQTATTLQGDDVELTLDGGNAFVNDAQVTTPDLGASNGIIHQIDGVLTPPSAGSGADVTVTIDNIGAQAYEVTSVEGAPGVAPTGTENPTLTLTVGTRYRIDNNGRINAHPFALQNADDAYLLRQEADATGSLEGDAGINYQEDDEGVTFTYTQALADAVAAYRCTFHASMQGSVETAN